jgi:hypothetical protein
VEQLEPKKNNELDGAGVAKDIFGSIVGLDEAKALLVPTIGDAGETRAGRTRRRARRTRATRGARTTRRTRGARAARAASRRRRTRRATRRARGGTSVGHGWDEEEGCEASPLSQWTQGATRGARKPLMDSDGIMSSCSEVPPRVPPFCLFKDVFDHNRLPLHSSSLQKPPSRNLLPSARLRSRRVDCIFLATKSFFTRATVQA